MLRFRAAELNTVQMIPNKCGGHDRVRDESQYSTLKVRKGDLPDLNEALQWHCRDMLHFTLSGDGDGDIVDVSIPGKFVRTDGSGEDLATDDISKMCEDHRLLRKFYPHYSDIFKADGLPPKFIEIVLRHLLSPEDNPLYSSVSRALELRKYKYR